jgi:SAM-dependent methyltransferase
MDPLSGTTEKINPTFCPSTTAREVGLKAPMSANSRSLSTEDTSNLHAGDDHYRAYVGPPDRYDLISALQFSILGFLGLRDTHNVLDFGCGSLRLGRLLIPYLQPGRYCGIDPNAWLIEAGLERELGRSAVDLKHPAFDHNTQFECNVFDRQFDFIMAQSVLTHTGMEPAKTLCSSLSSALSPRGLAVVNWIVGDHDGGEINDTPWLYPFCHTYSRDTIDQIYWDAGLVCKTTNWWHPGGAQWDILANREEDLPSSEQIASIDFRPLAR